MNFSDHLHQVINRSRAFYAATAPGHFLINVNVPTEKVPMPPLTQFDLETQLNQWLELMLQAARPEWAVKTDLNDDTVPQICPRFGIAEHTAWLGTDVMLQETTCLPVPLLNSPADFSRLNLNPDTRWFKYMKAGYDYLRSRQDGSFVLSVRGTMMPMDIANALRGDELLTDFILNPDFVHELMRFLVQAIGWYYQQLLSWVDKIEDGYIFWLSGGWIGGKCLGHVSNDLALLCSEQIYETFGLPYETKLSQQFESVFYHVHNERMHFLPHLIKLPNLALLEITNDPKTPAPIEELAKIFQSTGSASLMLHLTSEQLRKHIKQFKQRNVFFDVECSDRADAADIIALVRAHSRPLG